MMNSWFYSVGRNKHTRAVPARSRLYFSIAAALVLSISAGCKTPLQQVQRLEAEKDELKAAIRMQRDQNRTLQTELASLEQRLDQAETQLAGGTPRTLSQRTASSPVGSSLAAISSPPRPTAKSKPAPEDQLPWRPHRAVAPSNSVLPAIAQLARQDERVEVDPETGAGVWAAGVSFEPNTSALTPEGRQELAELAKLLQRSPASKFRVLVATSAERTGSRSREGMAKSGRQLATSRAQSVADYLDRHGIAEDRLAIASTGVRKSTRDQHGLPATGAEDVRIYLVDPEQPILGWLSPDTVRR